ncbi:thiamine-phosphate pyrophosphorylase [Polaromonas sp. OV174]|uniref:thiamine phosphate synthase n=1 Tax=Polaromonas sp. OV174 TaxID=1855300 RepID=UPI0008E2AB35|nr:thiamine phosphate synthase [Polaromonas sp. OV174]SFC67535.1 thiamine-phosphate pyrophosphorylase [Polaromonas sp. OV174]
MARLNPEALRLYLVTDSSLTRGRPLADVVNAAVQGGVSCVQLREKHLGTREFLAQALVLKQLLAPHRVPLVINDRIDIALACRAEGVHLGQSDMPVDQARKLLPPEVFIGWSVEHMANVQESAMLPVDYLGVSPIYATPTKTDTKEPWGLDGLALVRAATRLPLVAIGGLHAGNAREVLLAGADGLAVVSALCAADDPCAAALNLKSLCDETLKVQR